MRAETDKFRALSFMSRTRPLWTGRRISILQWATISLAYLALSKTCTAFSPTSSSQSATTASSFCLSDEATQQLGLDVKRLKETIAAGRVYRQRNFLNKSQVDFLLDEIHQLQQSGSFQRSGLSNTAQGKEQGFGSTDRSVGVVSWWRDVLLASSSDSNSSSYSSNPVATKMNQLRLVLSQLLDRPSMADATLAHECYYSTSTVGSVLPRHMDERHEELKGAKGWLLPSRRSLSWLIYLSDEDWTIDSNGGALRTFPQASVAKQQQANTCHHNGNLQVGWLDKGNGAPQPVYLNSWHVPSRDGVVAGRSPLSNEPHCVLYTVQPNMSKKNGSSDGIVYLTQPWLSEAIQGMSMADFIQALAEKDGSEQPCQLFLSQHYAQNFYLFEDRVAWDQGRVPQGAVIEDISPERGSLVVFDSVLLPHQVELVRSGRRAALAGWFHEETQPFPVEI